MKININKTRIEMTVKFTIYITALFMFCSALAHKSNGQELSNTFVTLSISNASLHDIFNEIEGQTPYRFVYDSKTKGSKEFSYEFDKTSLKKILDTLSEDTGTEFNVVNRSITVIKPIRELNNSVLVTLIEGKVLDENGNPLPGATVLVKGTSNGTTTDFDGVFSIDLNPGDILEVSYVGYRTAEITYSNQANFEISLEPAATMLDDIVLIGYGSVGRGDVSTSISVLDTNVLDKQLTSGFDQAMAGKLAGVQVLQTSGSPGGNISVRIRGSASISGGNEPLYVVDGVPLSFDTRNAGGQNSAYESQTNPLNALNPNDIKSIQILKDAAAAAIYGSRGSNGVVIITTKQGLEGKPQFNYSLRIGSQKASKKIDMLDAFQYSELTREARNNTYLDYLVKNGLNGSPSDSNSVREQNGAPNSSFIPDQILPYLSGRNSSLTNTDWQDEIFRNALFNSHTLSVSGGAEKIKYFASGNYLNQDGVVINSGYKRFGARINLNLDLDNVRVGFKLSPSQSNTQKVNSEGRYADEGVVALALGYAPIFKVYNDDGTFNFDGNGNGRPWGKLSQSGQLNPVAVATLTQDKLTQMNILHSSFIEFDFAKNFTYKLSFGLDSNNFRRDYYRPSSLERRFAQGPSNPIGRTQSDSYMNWTIENTVNYNYSKDNHDLNVLLGYTSQKNNFKSTWLSATNFPNDKVTTLNAGRVSDGGSREEEYALISYLSRVQYGFKNKYLMTGSIRVDGSSRFGTNNKYGYFPSISAAWKINQEDFLIDSKTISDLKLRASYGVTGNFEIGNYTWQGLLGSTNYGSNIGLSPVIPRNENLTWEKTYSTNIGLNLGLFNNKISLELDYYNSNTKDLLLELPVSSTSGYSSSLQNIGEVNNKGYEINLGVRNQENEFKWDLGFNLSSNKNKVVKLGPDNAPIITRGGAYNFFITKVGEPIGSYYTLVTDGIFETQEELDNSPHFSGAKVGDLKFVDVSGDGSITQGGSPDQEDRKITGNYFPDFIYGFSGDLSYKNFDLSFVFQGSQGNEVNNLLSRYINNVEGNFNNRVGVLDRFRSPSNPGNGVIYRANRVATGRNGWNSTWHIEDGSYLRLQNLSFGYSFPQTTLDKLGLKSLRASLIGQNIFTITKYSGYNPEVNGRLNVGGNLNNITPGEDYGTYPLSTTYSIGLNLSF